MENLPERRTSLPRRGERWRCTPAEIARARQPRLRGRKAIVSFLPALFLVLGLLQPLTAQQGTECLRLQRESLVCDPASPGQVTVTFKLQNLAAFPIDRLLFWVGTSGVTVTPDEFILPPVSPGGFSASLTIQITAPAGTAQACLQATIHDHETGACCAGKTVCVPMSCGAVEFRRGDANSDFKFDISDGIYILNYLFLGGPGTTCFDAMETNDDGNVDISDAVAIFGYLFLGRAAPPPPGPNACGPDPTDDNVTCEAYQFCP